LFSGFWGVGIWIRYYSRLYVTRKPDDFSQYITALRRNLNERGRMKTVIQMILASKAASEEGMPLVNYPVRVIMGSKDPDFKDSEVEARWVAERLRADYQIVQDSGHYPHAEMPEVTAPLVIDFLMEHHRKRTS
jgi:pimeloyl-ACP methyl ester carboxylesterase